MSNILNDRTVIAKTTYYQIMEKLMPTVFCPRNCNLGTKFKASDTSISLVVACMSMLSGRKKTQRAAVWSVSP